MNKNIMKYWMMGIACVGMLSTVTSCKEDEYPDNSIPTPPAAITPTEPTTQVLWPSNLQRVSVHDPSVVYDPSSWSYYIFGSHRAYAKSPNLMTWTTVAVPWGANGVSGVGNDVAFVKPEVTKVKKGGAEVDMPAFNAFEWSKKGNADWSIDGNMWAPDVVYNKAMKKWCMYLSINGDSWYSSIIMLTSDFIVGPYTYQAPIVISGVRNNENYNITDMPLALGDETMPTRYAPSDNYGNHWPNAIDPCVFYDEEGKLWMSYGSWSGGIFMLELDEETGLRDYNVTYAESATSDPYFGKKIAGGWYASGEASYIEYIGGYYHLFLSYGGLAAGGDPKDYNNGGYQMRVFRSEKPDGPYVDSKGLTAILNKRYTNFGPKEDDDNRGVNIFGAYDWESSDIQASGPWAERSQGHNSVIAAPDGRAYLVYHSRFQGQGEGHAVRVHQLFQNENGWLVAAPFEYTGEMAKTADIATKQLIAKDQIAGKYKLLTHPYALDHTKKEVAAPVDIQLNADNTVSGIATGTWSITEGKSYITIKLGTTEYKGVMVLQTLEPTNTQVPAFTCLDEATGVTIWGYRAADL